MHENILITGGTGLVGKQLTDLLLENHFNVAHLSRHPERSNTKSYYWDYEKNEIDPEAIEFADTIIHLAGENISGGRWTVGRKKKIIESRVKTSRLLFQAVKTQNKALDAFISASAIGFYGSYTSETILDEGLPEGIDFLAETVKQWEDSVSQFESLNIRTIKLRIGVVLSKNGGALPKIKKTLRTGFGSPIGSGKQYMPWIHIEDLSKIIYYMIENSNLSGNFNAVAPEHITNKMFMKTLAMILHKPFFMPNIPAFLMRMILGEMSIILLEGSRVSSEKLQQAGYRFKYPDLESALRSEC